jgi:hypothetical protein
MCGSRAHCFYFLANRKYGKYGWSAMGLFAIVLYKASNLGYGMNGFDQ